MLEVPKRSLAKEAPRCALSVCAAVLAFLFTVKADIANVLADDLSGSRKDGHSAAEVLREEERVSEIEQKLLQFFNAVEPDIDKYVEDPNMRLKLRKLIADFKKAIQTSNRQRTKWIVSFGEENGFWIDLVKSEYPGRFDGLSRVISLSDKFDAGSVFDLTRLVHELEHVQHDDLYRRTVPWDRYRNFYVTRYVIFVTAHEADAVAVQLELTNIWMKGGLKDSVRKGESPKGLPTDSPNRVSFITTCARAYWVSGGIEPLKAEVHRSYRAAEPDLRVFTEELVPVQAEQ